MIGLTNPAFHAILCKVIHVTERGVHTRFEKNLRYIMLFDISAELLTPTQKTMFDLYYNDDLSLAEVAENTGITRQGARDSIKRAEGRCSPSKKHWDSQTNSSASKKPLRKRGKSSAD